MRHRVLGYYVVLGKVLVSGAWQPVEARWGMERAEKIKKHPE